MTERERAATQTQSPTLHTQVYWGKHIHTHTEIMTTGKLACITPIPVIVAGDIKVENYTYHIYHCLYATMMLRHCTHIFYTESIQHLISPTTPCVYQVHLLTMKKRIRKTRKFKQTWET